MVGVAQLVRASDCGSEGRGFESHFSPVRLSVKAAFFCLFSLVVPVWKVCQNSHLLFYAQSPDFHKLGLCYNLKILYL